MLNNILLASLALILCITVAALVRQVWLRRAMQSLVRQLLSALGGRGVHRMDHLAWIILWSGSLLALLGGCMSDERVVAVAREAADRQSG